MEELYHHGIKGMKWYVRRYQNKDGSLTEEGKRRIGYSKYSSYDSDIIVPKGYSVSRSVAQDRYEEYADKNLGGSEEKAKAYAKNQMSSDISKNEKYVSVDNLNGESKVNGKDYYVSWFSDEGLMPNNLQVATYKTQKELRVASGKKVADKMIEEAGSEKIISMIRDQDAAQALSKNKSAGVLYANAVMKKLTMEYAKNGDFTNKINNYFKSQGYDAIRDINDLETDLPVVVLNSQESLGNPVNIQTGREAIKEILSR